MLLNIFLLFTVLIIIYLSSKTMYFQSINEREKKNSISNKKILKEAEIIIRKYQLQFIKSINSSESMIEELNSLKKDMKNTKHKNLKYVKETNVLRNKLNDAKLKLESLI